MNLLFNKKRCIKAVIVDTNKRIRMYVIRIDGATHFNIGKRTYIINYDAVYLSGSVPTYLYYVENPNAVTEKELEDHLMPVDMQLASKKIDISSTELYNAIEETISAKIIRYAEDGDKKIMNSIYIVGGIIWLSLVGGGYFLYTMLEKIWLLLKENEVTIKSIIDFLMGGDGG